jgi:Flp pilus assembly protein TadG
MDTTTIILIVLLIVVAAGVAFWYMNNQAATLAEAEAEAEAARLAAMTAAAEASAAADADADADADAGADADMPPAAGTHPLAGDKYIVVKGTETIGVIVPDSSPAKNFKLDTTGARTSKMVITLEAVEGEADTYFLFAKAIDNGKYMKYDNGGLFLRQKKPTTPKSLKPYKIKFTSIGDEYAMSYMDKDDVQMFFGYNGDGAMTSDKNVASILTTGLVALEDAGVSSYILTGNFGEENFTAFEIAVDDEEKPKTNIKGCLEALPDVDLGEGVDRDSLLAVAYKASEPSGDKDEAGNTIMTKPCRAYTTTGNLTNSETGTGWVTTCVDETKNIEQGCLL